MSKIADFYITNPDYVDVRAEAPSEGMSNCCSAKVIWSTCMDCKEPCEAITDEGEEGPKCKACGREITITEHQETDDRGIAIEYEKESGHDGMCKDKTKEKVIGGER